MPTFTVKATYGNETRRFTFPQSVVFPTYKELHDQLYRVFPINDNYYLSRLVFSPDGSKPGRILVGKEVHSAADYDSCVAPLRRHWPDPLLRFNIFDETPHNAPGAASARLSLYDPPITPSSEVRPEVPPPVALRHECILPLHTPTRTLPPPPSFNASPPPPIIFSPTPTKFCPIRECSTAGITHCCPVSEGKADIELLLSSFKDDLERILYKTFGTNCVEKHPSPSVKESTSNVPGVDVHPQTETPVKSVANVSRWCFVCRTSFTGVRYGCIKCPWHAVCPTCFSKSHSAHTLSFGPSHVVQQRSTDCSTQDSAPTSNDCTPATRQPPVLASSDMASEPVLAAHRGVICDSCEKTVVGVRHKCLDCPDYDLCTACVESGATEQHNPFHEFFDIEAPGRVYVHTVFGDNDRSPRNHQPPIFNHSPVVPQGPAAISIDPPVRHSASCNLCDSAIIGERYKCIVCPDFDTCPSCFRITTDQHPNHGFVKVTKPEDLMMRGSIQLRQVSHLAVCDSCQKRICGPRYKCMHPSCPDFDLCNDCEALPIPVHPPNHPMLKLKTSDAVVPTVHRVGQPQTADEPANQRSAQVCDESRTPPLLPRSPVATPMKPFELEPVAESGQATNETAVDQTPLVEEFLSPLGSPASDALGAALASANVVPPHLLVDIADPSRSPRSTHPMLDVYHQLWPKVSQEMMHLNAAQAMKARDDVIDPIEDSNTELVTRASPVAGELLPGISIVSSSSQGGQHETCPISLASDTNSIVDGYRTPPIPPNIQEPDDIVQLSLVNDQQGMVATNLPRQSCLDSALVGDINVPDGQIFPPGAEFVKGWHMTNNGVLSWPTTTEVQFVAGEMFATESNVALKVRVGAVHPGEALDIWTGDLKAPDIPGRYVGYWRLNDGQGNFFGSSVWIDLTIADHHSDQASEHSLASSSMVMPSANPTNPASVGNELQDVPQASLPSSKTMTDEIEDPESDISSVSLVSVPTSDGEDAEWQDTRTHSEPLEYVVLYGSNPEEY